MPNHEIVKFKIIKKSSKFVPTINSNSKVLLAIFNLEAENDGVNAFLVDFHFSPLELKRSVPSKITFGIGCTKSNNKAPPNQ